MADPIFKRTPIPPPAAAPAGPSMTDYTRKQLEALGWLPGDPQPPIEFTRELQLACAGNPDAIDPRTKLPDVTRLPAAAQVQLTQSLASHTKAAQHAQAKAAEVAAAASAQPLPEDVHPSIREAQRVALEAMFSPGVEIEDDRSPLQIQTPTPAALASAVAPPPADAKTDTPSPTDTTAGGLPALAKCPRCEWNLNTVFETQPTDSERERYVVATLGMQRFEKAYEILDGRMTIVFRSLLAKETRLCFQQLGVDLRRGDILGDGDYLLRLIDYRLCMSVARIQRGDVILQDIGPIFEQCDPKAVEGTGDTILIARLKWFNEDGITQESLRRIVAYQFRDFQRLQETLEAQTSEPDFWRGIGPPV